MSSSSKFTSIKQCIQKCVHFEIKKFHHRYNNYFMCSKQKQERKTIFHEEKHQTCMHKRRKNIIEYYTSVCGESERERDRACEI